MKKNVLFVCLQNSVCSQMAEAFVNQVAPAHFAAHSAGLLPGPVDPVAVAAMREIGLDISASRPKWIYDFLAMPMSFDFIITVCDASAERCPAFHGGGIRLHWSFPDQNEHYEDFEKRLTQFRKLRDAIQARVGAWCAQTTGTAAHVHSNERSPDPACAPDPDFWG